MAEASAPGSPSPASIPTVLNEEVTESPRQSPVEVEVEREGEEEEEEEKPPQDN